MDSNEYMAKQLEGNTSALGAIAETLTKMNDYLSKQEAMAAEEDEEEEKEEEAQLDKAAYDALVKSVVEDVRKSFNVEGLRKGIVEDLSKSISQLIKQDAPMADLNTDKTKKVGGTNWPMSSNKATPDQETPANIKNPTEAAQQTIEAAVKNVSKQQYAPAAASLANAEEEEPLVEDVVEEEEGAKEYPMEEEDGDLKAMVKNLQNQVANLTKEKMSIEKSLDKKIRAGVDGKLSKLGFREERGLARPKLIPQSVLGMDDKQILKSETEEEVRQKLLKMSWGDLISLRSNAEFDAGKGNAVPRELLR